jgi:glycerol uptake facilitator protein
MRSTRIAISAPRIFALIAGWGEVAFPGDYAHISNYFWVPIVGPLIGGPIAALFYDVALQDFLKARKALEPGVQAEGRVLEDRPTTQ